jgi:hypothetical protein
LSYGLKVIQALQWSPHTFGKLQTDPPSSTSNPPPLFLLCATLAALAGHVPRICRPRVAFPRATCPSAPCPPPSRPRAILLPPLHIAPPPPEPPAARRRRQLLLTHAMPLPALRHAQQRHHDLRYSLKHFFPRHFSFPTTAPHRTSAAPSGRRRQPPTPLPIPSPALLEHRCDSLQLTDPSNFAFPHPSIIPRSAGDLKLRRPLGLAVDPTLQSISTPTKSTNSTTSSHISFLATPSPPSDTPATRTPCRHRRR